MQQEPQAKEQWARFLVQHYGVGTLAGFGRWMQQDPDEAEAVLQVHTLKETETIAKLASGVRRFDLAPDYQFIPLLRRLSTGKQSNAGLGDQLVQVVLNRRQYAAGARELKRVITTHGKGKGNHRQSLLVASQVWFFLATKYQINYNKINHSRHPSWTFSGF